MVGHFRKSKVSPFNTKSIEMFLFDRLSITCTSSLSLIKSSVMVPPPISMSPMTMIAFVITGLCGNCSDKCFVII